MAFQNGPHVLNCSVIVIYGWILGVLAPSAGRTGQRCDIKTEDKNLTCFLRFSYRCILAKFFFLHFKFFCFFWKTLGKRRSIEKAKITVMCKYHKTVKVSFSGQCISLSVFHKKNKKTKKNKKNRMLHFGAEKTTWGFETVRHHLMNPFMVHWWFQSEIEREVCRRIVFLNMARGGRGTRCSGSWVVGRDYAFFGWTCQVYIH